MFCNDVACNNFCILGNSNSGGVNIRHIRQMLQKGADSMARNGLDRIALILVIIGAIVWLSVGLFQFDFVAALFGGASSTVSRIIYSVVGVAGIYSISLLFRNREAIRE